MNMLIVFSLGIFCASIVMKTDSIADRIGMRGSSQAWNNFLIISTLLTGIAMFSLMTYGFVVYKWWIPILAFIGLGVFSALIINGRTFLFFSLARPIFSLFSIITAIWCWMNYMD